MKTYVIMVSRTFPVTHKRTGEQTEFESKILSGEKIHTIRANYPLWKKRFEKIEAGEACLSLRYWSGIPRRSEQIEFLRLTKDNGIGIQRLDFVNSNFNLTMVDGFYSCSNIVDGFYCFSDTENSIAKNDGLSFDDFKDWFEDYELSEPMAVIHFTKFRY